jgi:hypothetical protein
MKTQLVLFAMGAVTLEFASVVMLDAIGDGEADMTDGGDGEIDDRDGDAVMCGDCGMGVSGGRDDDADGGMDVIGG